MQIFVTVASRFFEISNYLKYSVLLFHTNYRVSNLEHVFYSLFTEGIFKIENAS